MILKNIPKNIAHLTREFGLIKGTPQKCADEISCWMNEVVLSKIDDYTDISIQQGNPSQLVANILPGSNPYPFDQLFLETTSGWTVFFENGVLGTDAANLIHRSELLKTQAIRCVSAPEKKDSSDKFVEWPATIFEFYENGEVLRVISSVNDGGRWDWFTSGEPFDFEPTANYTKPQIRDRFSYNDLKQLLKNLGIDIDSLFFTGKAWRVHRYSKT